ncbi:MAG: hypothetical protein KAR57_00790 [Bacteroidales bacterium]|nr:hypothetical protein [Bacteroidales bacterium]
MINEQEKNSKSIRKLCWFFIVTGIIEVFYFVFITHNILAIMPGLITIFPAYFTLNKNTIRRRYFVGIWPLIKFNPVGVAIIAFLLGDFFANAPYNYSSVIFPTLFIIFLPIGLLSLILGIILIVKISRHNKYLNLNK